MRKLPCKSKEQFPKDQDKRTQDISQLLPFVEKTLVNSCLVPKPQHSALVNSFWVTWSEAKNAIRLRYAT